MERDEFGRFVKGHKGLSGNSNPMKNPEIAKKVSETKKRHFGEGKKFGCYNYWLRKKRSKETIEKIRETKRLQHQDPNSIYNSKEWNERRIENSIKRGGRNYQSWQEYEKQRIEHFAKCGWKCLVIWEDELEDEQNLLEKIKVFMNEEK
jgi:hypothetical protein